MVPKSEENKAIMVKIPLKQKIFLKYISKKSNLVKWLNKIKKDKDFLSTKELFQEILISGTLINLGLLILGIPLSLWTIVSLGSFYWMIENKFLDIVTRVISSFQPIRSYK